MKVRTSFLLSLAIVLLLYSFVPIEYTVKELVPYKNEANELIKIYCPNNKFFNPRRQVIYFANLKYPTIGYAHVDPVGYRIVLDKKTWDRSSESDKYQIWLHEFSHAVLRSEHVDNPLNYMYYSLIPLKKETIKQEFIEEIKKKCQ